MTDTAPAPHSITVTPGPYLVHGGLPLRRQSIVYSEHGEPLTWRSEEALEGGATVALCRCGASSNKPYCDGTHQSIGFDGTEAALTSTYDERARTFQGTGVVMRDDRAICEHAGFCGNRQSNVWAMVGDGATADSIARSQLMAMVERCPSGALTYRIEADEDDIEPALAPSIAVTDDGPLYVTGRVPVSRADGQPFETRNRVTLCRCGASDMKPLCDGSHKEAGFRDR